MTKQESDEDKKKRLNREKQAKYEMKQKLLGRAGRKLYTTEEEHVWLKCKLRELRDE